MNPLETLAPPSKTHNNKTQFVYDYVLSRVLSGEFGPGASLNIGVLAEETGVSLIPTREALRLLESEGLIEFVFHRGVRVREVTVEEYHDMMQAEAVIEALAVSLSAELLTYRDVAQAREINTRMNEAQAAGDFASYNRLSLEFHSLLRRPCPNKHLTELLEKAQFRLAAMRAAMVGYHSTTAQRLSAEHEYLLDRIATGAPASEIEKLVREHREGTLADDAEMFRRTMEVKIATGAVPVI